MSTHTFDVELAERYGINAAIILQNIAFWVEKNRANGIGFHDGRYWTFMSYSAFEKLFPYLGIKQIRGALSKLKEEGLIMTGNYSTTGKVNRIWYTLTDEGERAAHIRTQKKTECQNDTQACQNDIETCQNDTQACQNDTAKKDVEEDSNQRYFKNISGDDDNARACELAKRIIEQFGQHREPSAAEIELCKYWLVAVDISPDVIVQACELTLTAAVPSFGYLIKVVDTLLAAGVKDMVGYNTFKAEKSATEKFAKKMFAHAGLTKAPTGAQRERIGKWRTEYHLSDELLLLMADKARSKAEPFDYMCTCAEKLHDADIVTPYGAAEVLDKIYAPRKPESSSGGYAMHNYTAEDLAHIGVNLDDDEE